MKIIISPAKLQKPRSFFAYNKTALLFKEITDKIHQELKHYSLKSIGKTMNIKGPLLKTTYENIHNCETMYTAIDLYSGIVFKELNIFSYDNHQLDYLEAHLRILSAYYGLLKPSTGIYPYRLDLSMKLKSIDTRKLWGISIEAYFKGETIINLASKEFSSLIKEPMINVYFQEEQSNGELKIITVRAKKARGLMLDYMVQNTIENPELLKNFHEMGYQFHESLSTESKWIFMIPYESI